MPYRSKTPSGAKCGKRHSKYIARRQARNLLDALAFADQIGLRLNVAVDINWLMFSGTVDDRTRFSRCQQRLSKWAKRRGFALTLIWTRELGRYGSPHTHVLIHVPPWLMEFQRISVRPRTCTRTGRRPQSREGDNDPAGIPSSRKAPL